MKYVLQAMLLIVGIIHLLPLSGVISGQQLESLYGISLNDPNLVLLMRHRAVLFGLLGAFLCVSAFKSQWQGAALIAGFVSVLSFLLLEMTISSGNEKIMRVVIADWIALFCLIIATAIWWRLSKTVKP
jgi:hypothetical protein